MTIAWTKPYSCAFTALGILDNLFLMSAFSLNLGKGCTINLLCLLLVPSLSPKFWSLEFWSPRPKFSLENMVRPLQNRYAGKFVSVKHSYQSICVRRLFIPCTDKLTMVQVDQFSRIWSLGPKFSLDQNFHWTKSSITSPQNHIESNSPFTLGIRTVPEPFCCLV